MAKFIKNAITITLPALIILLFMLELFFRFVIPAMDRPRTCFDDGDRILKFCPDAGTGRATFGKFAQQRGRWEINDHGWNSPIAYRTEKDRPRIAVIGDSYIEAFHVDTDKSYPSLMRAEIGDRHDVYSYGISGASLSEYLNISRYVNRHFDPDVVIFNIRYNDFAESVFELNPADTHMLMISITDSSVTETEPRPNYSFSQFSLKRRILRKSAIARYLIINRICSMNACHCGFHACKDHIDNQRNAKSKERGWRITQRVDLRIEVCLNLLKSILNLPSITVYLSDYFGICRSF